MTDEELAGYGRTKFPPSRSTLPRASLPSNLPRRQLGGESRPTPASPPPSPDPSPSAEETAVQVVEQQKSDLNPLLVALLAASGGAALGAALRGKPRPIGQTAVSRPTVSSSSPLLTPDFVSGVTSVPPPKPVQVMDVTKAPPSQQTTTLRARIPTSKEVGTMLTPAQVRTFGSVPLELGSLLATNPFSVAPRTVEAPPVLGSALVADVNSPNTTYVPPPKPPKTKVRPQPVPRARTTLEPDDAGLQRTLMRIARARK